MSKGILGKLANQVFASTPVAPAAQAGPAKKDASARNQSQVDLQQVFLPKKQALDQIHAAIMPQIKDRGQVTAQIKRCQEIATVLAGLLRENRFVEAAAVVDQLIEAEKAMLAAYKAYEELEAAKAASPLFAKADQLEQFSSGQLNQEFRNARMYLSLNERGQDWASAKLYLAQLETVLGKLAVIAEQSAKYEAARKALKNEDQAQAIAQSNSLPNLIQAFRSADYAITMSKWRNNFDEAIRLLPPLQKAIDDLVHGEAARVQYVAARDALRHYQAAQAVPPAGLARARAAFQAAYQPIDQLVQQEKFADAELLLPNFQSALDTFLALAAAKQQYETTKAALPNLAQAKAIDLSQLPVSGKAFRDAAAALAAVEQTEDFAAAARALPAFQAAIPKLLAADTAYKKYEQAWAPLLPDYARARNVKAKSLKKDIDKHTQALDKVARLAEAEKFAEAENELPNLKRVVDALLAAAAAHDAKAKPKVDAAVAAVTALAPAALKQSTNDKKIDWLNTLRSLSSGMTPKLREVQRIIYNSMDLNPAFKLEDNKRRARIANKLTDTPAKIKALKEKNADWNARNPDGTAKVTQAQKLQVLKDALQAQSAELGIHPPPEVVEYDKAAFDNPAPPPPKLMEHGHFDQDDGKIYINTNPRGKLNTSLGDALDLAMHENFHNYQGKLVADLDAGRLKADSPEYQQALLFKVNLAPGAYVNGQEDYATYNNQPLEKHAKLAGPDLKNKILARLTAPPPRVQPRMTTKASASAAKTAAKATR